MNTTYHTSLEFWGFPIKHIHWLYAILYHTNGTIEEAHEMTVSSELLAWGPFREQKDVPCSLPSIVGQHLPILLPYRNEELVDRH